MHRKHFQSCLWYFWMYEIADFVQICRSIVIGHYFWKSYIVLCKKLPQCLRDSGSKNSGVISQLNSRPKCTTTVKVNDEDFRFQGCLENPEKWHFSPSGGRGVAWSPWHRILEFTPLFHYNLIIGVINYTSEPKSCISMRGMTGEPGLLNLSQSNCLPRNRPKI